MSQITTTYAVTGMTCGHCEMSVTEEVTRVPGVDGVQISAPTGRLDVTSSAPVDDAGVLAAVTKAGYSAQRA
ncbi:heavy-metal-associated domain-containing protein [Promicromonospora soli]